MWSASGAFSVESRQLLRSVTARELAPILQLSISPFMMNDAEQAN
jgi:hypothetical protein